MRAPTRATERVGIIEEDNAWSILLRVAEAVTHPSGTDADEHLHEIRAAQREVGNLGLARHRAREERLARPGRAVQQDPPRHARSQLTETAERLQEFDDLLQLVFRLLDAHHLRKVARPPVTGPGFH